MKKTLKIFAGLIICYFVLTILVTAIPNSEVVNQVRSADWVFEFEGHYPEYFFYTPNAQLDNVTDYIMVEHALTDENHNVLYNAMSVSDYARYWHGYLVILKPLLMVFSYVNIRTIIMIVFFMLFLVTFYTVAKNMNLSYALFWGFSICLSYVNCVSVSLQFVGMFLLMMLHTCIMAKLYPKLKDSQTFNLFFVMGSVTNFIDFLTMPLITLGMPLIITILYDLEMNREWKTQIKNIFVRSMAWVAGYALTWISKWIFATLILRENVIWKSVARGFTKIEGTEENVVNRWNMLGLNISQLVTKGTIPFYLLIILLFVVLLIRYKKNPQMGGKDLVLLLAGAYPYVWYLVMGAHSQKHYWFAYRNQIVTVFALLCFLYRILNTEKIKSLVAGRINRK